MVKFKYLYDLQHIDEIRIEDEEEINVKRLGIFTSKKQINEAIKVYTLLLGFKDKCKVAGGYDDLIEGFFISRMPIGVSEWEGGFFTYSGYINEQEDEDIEMTLNLPSWFSKDTQDQPGENSIDFAERIMQQKYHTSDYPRGPQSEFYQIKKFKELYDKQLL
ncbi:MAG: hypothetical protein BGO68_06005 [Candidatus Amoebophilus sp. 36-38]|nr:MAG: hypothetical protein BGO68_06005 [Candidatus Amoebophilus sp. 36-38]